MTDDLKPLRVRHGNRNPQNIYQLHADGTETFCAVAMSEELARRFVQAINVSATCTCLDSYETYGGPEAECPVHGSVRALNEAMAAIDRHRDRAATLTAWAHAELGQETRVLHYVLSVIVNLSDTLVLPVALDEPEPEPPPPAGPLRWHYGEPGDARMWCYDCKAEVLVFKEGYICTGCGRDEGLPAALDGEETDHGA